MSPASYGLVTGLACGAAAELLAPLLLRLGNRGEKPRAATPSLAIGLIIAAAVLASAGAARWPSLDSGPELLWLVLGALALFAAGLATDVTVPATKRHFFGTILGALLLVVGGFGIPWLTIPGAGTVQLGTLSSALLTLFWVFVVVGIVELCSLLPLLAGLVALSLGAAVWLPVGARETVAGLALSGALAGCVLGHGAAMLLKAESRPPGKADTLVLGFFCAAATLTTFLKSVTAAGFILPLAVATVVLIVLGMSSFERSLLLRASPRE